MNTGVSRKVVFATTIRLVARLSLVASLFAAGCMTVHSERTSGDQSLRSRTVRGPRNEVFDLAVRCAYREFPDGVVRGDAIMGQIVVTDYSIIRGDAVLKVAIIGWPDDRVEVNASATGLVANEQRKTVAKFLGDFDLAYADWVKERMTDRPSVQ
jgi:hypothetical protein